MTPADAPKRSILPSLALALVLLSSSLALVPTIPVLLLLTAEGAASIDTHPENLAFVLFAGTTLVAWPLATLVGWILLALGRRGLALGLLLATGVLVSCAGGLGIVLAAFTG